MRGLVIEKMMDEVIREYGFEAQETIKFCSLCEKSKNYALIKAAYNRLIKK